jgi:hypothetical protein
MDFLAELNRDTGRHPGETELGRIQGYELAARMQLEAAAAIDLSKESAATRKLYGWTTAASYGTRCLMARRLIRPGALRAGVPPTGRRGTRWRHEGREQKICGITDLPYGLHQDAKSRGLWEYAGAVDGEFGQPVCRTARDAITTITPDLWLAAAASGRRHGAHCDFGYKSLTDRSVCRICATLLHQLGLDHRRLTYPFRGRDETLTDAPVSKARVVAGLLEKAPEFREEEAGPGASIGLSGSLTIGPPKP